MALLFLKPLINEWNPNPCIIWPPSPSPAVHLLGGFPSFPLLQAFGFLLPTSFPHMPKCSTFLPNQSSHSIPLMPPKPLVCLLHTLHSMVWCFEVWLLSATPWSEPSPTASHWGISGKWLTVLCLSNWPELNALKCRSQSLRVLLRIKQYSR